MGDVPDRARHIRRGLLGGIAALIVLAMLTGAVLAVSLGAALDRLNAEVAHADELSAEAARLRAALLDQQTGLRGYQLTGNDTFLQPFRLGGRAEQGALDVLLVEGDHPELAAGAREVARLASAWRTEWAQPQMALVAEGRLEEVRENVLTGRGQRLFNEVRGALGRVDLAIGAIRADALAAVQATRQLVDVVIVAAIVAYGSALLAGAWWAFRRIAAPLDGLVTTAEALERGEAVQFVAQRRDEIGTLAMTLERLQRTVQQRYETATAVAERSAIFNRLSELVSYADDEDAVIRAGAAALERLVPNRGGEVLLVNPSFDQLRVHSAWGTADAVLEGRLPVDRPSACPAIRRNAVHVTRSALDAFTLTCEIHPLRSGSLLCVPMISHNEVIGVVHVERDDEDAFDDEDIRTAARVAEQVALAMANLRLMRQMERQAMTDPLTGLANPRSFDPLVERELALARREGNPVAVVMLDLDRFKEFNDTHGHPAGDEALRAFARTVRGNLRESDVASRYGGEEFALLLRRTDLAGARSVAEKVRAAVEAMPIEIGPNRFARITVSLGITSSEVHGTERLQLMRLADAALYAAKRAGRNRVEVAPTAASATAAPATEPGSGAATADDPSGPTPLHRRDAGGGPIRRRARRAGGFDPAEDPTV